MSTQKLIYSKILFIALLLGGCSGEDTAPTAPVEQPLAVSFSTYLKPAQQTRVLYPEEPTAQGELNDTRLRTACFGIFAAHTGNETFAYNGTSTGLAPFNFMWNQQVGWGDDRWTYSPLKYWPNDNQPADDQTPPAQGSQEHSYLSFFGYAPYSNGDDHSADDDAEGIIGMSLNNKNAGESYIHFRTLTMQPSTSVDLLWSRNVNRYKMDGAGYVDGQVQMNFIHALSKITVNVKAIVDHASETDTDERYPADLNANTRIFIESVELLSPTVYAEGHMLLAPQPDDATTPRWTDLALPTEPTWNNTNLNASIAWTGTPADQPDAATAKDDFDALPTGVTTTNKQLFSTAADNCFVFPPSTADQYLQARVVYYVVTYDPSLKLNTPKYYSIVRNDITYTSPTANVKFEPNKIYTLQLYLGLTTVKFSIDGIEDWAEPITLDGIVRDPATETHEVNVE